ncbi:putative peroxidase [Helianthus annuus]|nr:putative peroxidase [Helianthus annuus]
MIVFVRDHPDDISLAGDGFDTVIKAKAALDSNPSCRNKVSCADILALATRDVIVLVDHQQCRVGKKRWKNSTKASVQNNLPHPDFKLDQLNTMFAKHGLSQTDMIALSGRYFTSSSVYIEYIS